MTMKIETITVTPKLAHEWLTRNNPNNRTISKSRVSQFAEDMMNGKWQLNGETISFNVDGVLVDGQHRLQAVVLANTNVVMNVCTGVANDVYIFDRGRSRTIADIAKIQQISNMPNANAVAALVRGVYETVNCKKIYTISDTKVFNYYSVNKADINRAIHFAYNTSSKAVMKKSSCALAMYVALRTGYPESVLEDFGTCVNTGFAAPEQSAAIVLRNYLIDNKLAGRSRTDDHNTTDVTLQALRDFAAKNARKKTYRAGEDTTGLIATFKETEKAKFNYDN